MIRISEKHGTHVFGLRLRGRKTPVMLATASAQVCVLLGHSSLYFFTALQTGGHPLFRHSLLKQ